MKITKETIIEKAIEKYPELGDVFFNYGLHCIGCHLSDIETIEQGANSHGLSKKQLNNLIKDMNDLALKHKS